MELIHCPSQSCFIDESSPTDTFNSNSCDGTEKKPNAANTGEQCTTTCTLINTLEDREERAKSQTGCCSSEHAQRHISTIVTLAFPNNNVVHSGSRVPTLVLIRISHSIGLPISRVYNLCSMWWRCNILSIWTRGINLLRWGGIFWVGGRSRCHHFLCKADLRSCNNCINSGVLKCHGPCQSIICTVCTQTDDPSISADYLEQGISHLSLRWVQLLTCSSVADVNAVDPHVDVVLHVTSLLIIIEHKSSIGPQVKPVSFPPTQYGTLSMKPTTLYHSHLRSSTCLFLTLFSEKTKSLLRRQQTRKWDAQK